MRFIIVILAFVVVACNNNPAESKDKGLHRETELDKQQEEKSILSKADSIVRNSISFHGGEKYESASYSFVFRGKEFSFKNAGSEYHYTSTKEVDGDSIHDEMTNTFFKRRVNGNMLDIPDSMAVKYGNTLNSVIYFATLPHKLGDPAVLKTYNGLDTINDVVYEKVEVRFRQDGGGTDHDDVYLYWFRKDNYSMDYLAYLYHVNGGGVRFRSFYNRRTIDGVIFQDYINHKAPVGTPLEKLSSLFEDKKLEELSRIETEKVRSI